MKFYKDWSAGIQVLSSYLNSSFFSWDRGSRLIFWRWHPLARQIARNGFDPFLSGPNPQYFRRPHPFPDPERRLFFAKVKKFIERAYLIPDEPSHPISNTVDFFAVPKEDSDICPVFNGTSCGLNRVLWAPNFWLPTSSSLLNSLHYNYESVDLDLGEMFINFTLHKTLQSVSGVDLTQFRDLLEQSFPELKPSKKRILYKWSRHWMAMKASPYWSARFFYLMEEFLVGNPAQNSNPFRWDKVTLNLTGGPTFNPTLPFVIKWDSELKLVAAAIFVYVDDLRLIAATRELAWQASHRAASYIQYLGSQDAPRKKRLDNGPWAGTVFNTKDGAVTKSVTQSKWDRGLEFKRLEKIREVSSATWR